MAKYRIAQGHEKGSYHIVKVSGKGGCKATIIPTSWHMLRKVYCESLEDLVALSDFEIVRTAPGA
jgi:hypothetical protein